MSKEKSHTTRWILLVFFCFLASCTFTYQNIEFERAKKAEQNKDYEKAITHYRKILLRKPDSKLALQSANRAGDLALLQVKDFQAAIEFAKHIIVYAEEKADRLRSQKRIAEIYFDKLKNYRAAILSYNRLLELPHSGKENFEYRFRIARSYFQTEQFFQAHVEIDTLLSEDLSPRQKFDTLLFKGNIYLTTRDLPKAAATFQQLISQFPKLSDEESVGLNLAVVYEEQNEYAKAVGVLKELKESYPSPEFIELKIRRLEQRKKNLPGAGGLRK